MSGEGFQLEIEEGVVHRPERIVVYGPQGIGKSTFASGAPKPFFLDLEGGTTKLNVARNKTKIESWPHFLAAIDQIAEAKHSFETLVIDTLDRAEWLATQHLCQNNRSNGKHVPVQHLSEVAGGYGKGYEALYEEFRRLFGRLERRIWEGRGMNIVILAHAKLENVKNPSGPDYQRYSLKVHERVASMFYEVADAVLFANREVTVLKDGVHDGKRYRASSNNAPFLYTAERTAFAAKNRYNLPPRIELSWAEFAKGVAIGHNPSFLVESIRTLSRTMPGGLNGEIDGEFVSKVDGSIERVGADVSKLVTLQGWVMAQIAKRNEQIERQLEERAVQQAQEHAQQAQAQ